MAARYWVGGTGNWSDAASHWSDTSGGAPGAVFLPTSTDDAIFDNNSHTTNFILTLNVNSDCKNLDFSGLTTRGCSFLNSGNNKILSVYGSYHISAMVSGTWAGNSKVILKSTAVEGISFYATNHKIPTFEFNGIGGKWVAQHNMIMPSIWTLINGELDINGMTVQIGSFGNAAGLKTLTLNAGIFKMTSFSNTFPTNFTFNYDTGTIHLICGSSTISGSTTFYNLTFESEATEAWKVVTLGGNQTIVNELNINGLDNRYRILVQSSVMGTRRTLTSATNNIQYADFMDTTGAGAGSWNLSGAIGGSGDGGNNSGIIFTTPKTCYWYGAGGDWVDDTKWFSATNGGGVAGQFPICHDDVIFDGNSLPGNETITYNATATCKNLDCSAIIHSLTINTGSSNARRFMLWGSAILNNLVSFPAATFQINFYGRGNYYLNSGTVDIKYLILQNYNGMLIFLSNVIASVGATTQGNTLSSFDMNGFDFTTPILQVFGKSIYLRSGTLTLTGNAGSVLYYVSGIFDPGTSTIKINPVSGSSVVALGFFPATPSFYKLEFGGNHTGFFEIYYYGIASILTVSELKILAGKKFRILGSRKLKVHNFIADGTSGNLITIGSTDTNQHTIENLSINDITVSYCNISYSNVTGTPKIKTVLGKTWASMSKTMGIAKASIKKIMGVYVNSAWNATNSTDSGNNTGWNITS